LSYRRVLHYTCSPLPFSTRTALERGKTKGMERARQRAVSANRRRGPETPFAPPGFAVMTGKGRQIDLFTISAPFHVLQSSAVLVP